MNFFAKFSKPKLTDPSFGTLTLEKHGWSGEAPWLEGSHVQVTLPGNRTGPDETCRNAFLEFRGSYSSLKLEIRSALFTLWQPEMNQTHWEGMAPLSPEALWSMLELDSISFRSDGRLVLQFGFSGEFWPDGMFTVEVDGSTVSALSLDD